MLLKRQFILPYKKSLFHNYVGGAASIVPFHGNNKNVNNNLNKNRIIKPQQHHHHHQAWQLLLRSSETKTSESLQEELQKIEDEYLLKNYYIRDERISLIDAIINTSILEEMPFISNHIIIIGKALSNLYDLIRPLRAKSVGNNNFVDNYKLEIICCSCSCSC